MASKSIKAGEAYLELSVKDRAFLLGIDAASAKLQKLGASIKAVGTDLLIFGTASGAALLGAVKLAAGMEAANAAFTALTGSAERAKEILEGLQAFSGRSSFGFDTLQGAARNMLNFGVEAARVLPLMEQLGAIAAGDADRLDRLAIAFGQTQAKGRLMAEEVRQMVNAGFNPLQEIARTSGKSMAVLLKEMEAGSVTADQVAKSFETVTSAGGRFDGLLAKVANTTTGQFRKALAGLRLAAIDLGNQLLPAITDILKAVNSAVPSLRDFIQGFTSLGLILAGATVSTLALGAAMYSAGKAMTFASAAMKLFTASWAFILLNPGTAALAGIAAGGLAIAAAYTSATGSVKSLTQQLKSLEGATTAEGTGRLDRLRSEFDRFAAKGRLTPEEQQEANDVIRKLQDEYGPLAAVASARTGRVENVFQTQAQLKAAQANRSRAALRNEISAKTLQYDQLKLQGAGGARLSALAIEIANLVDERKRIEKIVADANIGSGNSPSTGLGFSFSKFGSALGSLFGGEVGKIGQSISNANRNAVAQNNFERELSQREAVRSLEDEIAAQRISNMKDGFAKEKAQIELNRQQRLRDLKEQGILNPSTIAKVNELAAEATKGIKDFSSKSFTAASTFSSSLGGQIFGVGGPNAIPRQQLSESKKTNKLLEEIRRRRGAFAVGAF